MTKEELYLKTIFCCIACDGDIATEEVDMVKDLCAKDNIFHDVDSEKYLNSWITEINEQGGMFLQSYLKELNSVDLNETEQLLILSLAIKAIEADNRIEYTVYGINKENGKVVWKHATGAPVFGSVALSGNALVVSDFGGNVYLFCK